MNQTPIPPTHLIPMDGFKGEPLSIDVVYANASHPRNVFGEGIYAPLARLWLHMDLAAITLLAARLADKRMGWTFQLKDGLRTVEAQGRMEQTAIVRKNPHWLVDGPKRLLSPPGAGAHPRAMAIDVCPIGADGVPVDMGTEFDHFTDDPDAPNPAARAYTDFPASILQNRRALEGAFIDAAGHLGLSIVPLESEWWDFRLPAAIWETFAPLRDSDLPPGMRMTVPDEGAPEPAHIPALQSRILDRLAGRRESA